MYLYFGEKSWKRHVNFSKISHSSTPWQEVWMGLWRLDVSLEWLIFVQYLSLYLLKLHLLPYHRVVMESHEQEIFTQSFFMIINVTKWLYFFQELEKDPRQPVYSKTATHFLENYKFPVMMILALSNGTIIHRVNANDFMHKEDSSPTMMESFMNLL